MCTLCDCQLYAGDEVVRTGRDGRAGRITYAHLECVPTFVYDDDVTVLIGWTPRMASTTTDPVRAHLDEMRGKAQR